MRAASQVGRQGHRCAKRGRCAPNPLHDAAPGPTSSVSRRAVGRWAIVARPTPTRAPLSHPGHMTGGWRLNEPDLSACGRANRRQRLGLRWAAVLRWLAARRRPTNDSRP